MVRGRGLYSKGLTVVRDGLLPIWAVQQHRLNFHRHYVRVSLYMVGSRIIDDVLIYTK
jgi:hypothetical protein